MAHIVYVGHVTTDLGPPDRFGGSVLYGGLVAHGLGDRVTVCTCAQVLPAGLPFCVLNQPCDTNTQFENVYDQAGRRTQHVRALAPAVAPVPNPDADWLHLAPVAGEVNVAAWARTRPPNARLALSIQGVLRVIDASDGRVSTRRPALEELKGVDVVFASTEDLSMNDALRLRHTVSCVVLTDGPGGAYVLEAERVTHAAALRVDVVDPTGAGDAFAAGFLHGIDKSVEAALQLGTAAASVMIEHPGTSGAHALDQVLVRAREVVVRSVAQERTGA